MTHNGKWCGVIQSEAFNGEAMITITEDSLIFERASKFLVVLFSEIDAFSVQNYRLILDAEGSLIVVSLVGQEANVLCERLWDAYNARTLQAFFIQSEPHFEAQCEYKYADDGGQSQGHAKIKLFDNCLCILPQGSNGRRIPLCFMSEPMLTNFMIKLTLDTGETYEFIRLGDRLEHLYELININLMKIRDDSIKAVRSFDRDLDVEQASNIALLVTNGATASLATLSSIAKSFVKASEDRIAGTRAMDTYSFFKASFRTQSLYLGIKKGLTYCEYEADIAWAVAVQNREDGCIAAAEHTLADNETAETYIYKFKGDQTAFLMRLNHAMEAISFHCEVMTLSAKELTLAPNALYAMAIKRTSVLRYLRECFAGCAIHKSPEAWRSSIVEWMG